MIAYSITIGLGIIFIISSIQDRRKLMNGFLFNMLVISAMISLLVYAEYTRNSWALGVLSFIFIAVLLLLTLGTLVIMILSFASSIKLMRREGRHLSNMLSMSVFLLLVLVLVSIYSLGQDIPTFLYYILAVFYMLVAYFTFIFANFIVGSFLYRMYQPRLNKDYIIILGSGLLAGYQVTPLLARRVDRGIAIYVRQNKKKKHRKVKFIMSGGRGGDELISEARAMREYALTQGIPESDIVMEENSKDTFENMLYSKKIIEAEGIKRYHAVFATSNYHVFRASIYARKVGLKAQGIGIKTPFYFWYNAVLREYIAIIVMYKKVHVVICVVLSIIAIASLYVLWHPWIYTQFLNMVW